MNVLARTKSAWLPAGTVALALALGLGCSKGGNGSGTPTAGSGAGQAGSGGGRSNPAGGAGQAGRAGSGGASGAAGAAMTGGSAGDGGGAGGQGGQAIDAGGGQAGSPGATASRIADKTDWARFLGRHDLVWDALPTGWADGAFLGNGLVGAMVYREGGNRVVFRVGRTDIYDQRTVNQRLVINDPAFWHARLPVGDLRLGTQGTITGGSFRLDLWNAELRGTVTTSTGTLEIRAFAHADRPVLVVEVTGAGQETNPTWSFAGAPSVSSRVERRGPAPAGYDGNPAGRDRTVGEVSVWEQPLLGGGGYATAWSAKAGEPLVLSVDIDHQSGAVDKTAGHVTAARGEGLAALRTSHTERWHALYRRHLFSFPDPKLESLYWIQIYKLASAGRADGPVIDLMGPWYDASYWPAVWWNLNVQLTYYPIYAANLLPIGESLLRTLEAGKAKLATNVPDGCNDCIGIGRVTGLVLQSHTDDVEVGHLPWALHNVYMMYRHTMDDGMLRDRIFPLLRQSANLYLHLLQEEGGQLHLPRTNSPEYGITRDANYDLALLRWQLETLIVSAERLGIADPLLPRWKDTLARLTPFPTDAGGLRVGRDLAFDQSHRHYSHLLAIYPLHLIRWDDPGNRDLITRSFERWSSLRQAWRGYSWTGAAAIQAIMGKGNEALSLLQTFADREITPTTMYSENSPVIETPPSAARSLQDMVLQSGGGTIRVFPAVPSAWQDVTIHDLRAEGAFLVSAVRKGGKTQFIRVQSLAGEPCRLQTDLPGPYTVQGPEGATVTPGPNGTLTVTLGKGQEVVLTTQGTSPELSVAPVPLPPTGCANYFGSRRCHTPGS